MTFSLVARDPTTGDLGVAVASKFLAVGSVVPWAQAGVGAIATQAYANVRYGPDGLAALAAGVPASEVLAGLTTSDELRADRQAGLVDGHGGAASHTGSACLPWAGGRTGEGYAAQGNLLAGPGVVDALIEAYVGSDGPTFAARLLDGLLAADRAGGDARGRQSAALLVVRAGGGYAGGDDRLVDLRVDDHVDPVPELQRLYDVWRLLLEPPTVDELVPIDAGLATKLRRQLTTLGWAPGRDDALATSIRATLDGTPRIGEARPWREDWDAAWDGALATWMGVANLEARTAAPGWIDPCVLEALAAAADG
jgi:uncharacterized Ntn-hydrolase superfamily protein